MRSSAWSWLAAFALVSVAGFVMSAFGDWPDAAEARTCRRLAPAINPPDSTIQVKRSSQLPDHRLEIVYEVRSGDAPFPRERYLVCAFSRSLPPDERLVSVLSDGVPIGEVRLAFFKRFWLNSPEAAEADPEPYMQIGVVPEIPLTAAIGAQHAISALPLISIYALLASAYALIYGLLGRINLAFGEFAAIGGYGALLAYAITGPGGAWWIAFAACLLLGIWTAAMHGAVIGKLVFAPLRSASGQHMMIATIGLAIALQEYLRLSQGTALRWIEPMFNQPVGLARSGSFVVTITPIAALVTSVALAAAICLVMLLGSTRFGRHWRACSDDPTAAKLLGINPSRVLATSFILASGLAGLAGTISAVFYGGLGYAGGIVLGLKALIAAIAGGIGSIPGALIGGILIGSLETLWSALFPIEYRDLAVYCALAALLIWRPQGVISTRDPYAR